MKKYLYVLFLAFFYCPGHIYAQLIEPMDSNPLDFRVSVKQIEEFMKRFNQDEFNELIKEEKDPLLKKEHNMTALFNFEFVKQHPEEVKEFVREMLDNNIRLHFADTTWTAIAECNATYKGKPTRITLSLGTEYIGQSMYKWVIKGAEGNALKSLPEKANPGLKISPTDNEVNFMSLGHITSVEAKNILNYKASFREIDELTAFFTLVHNGLLKIQYVQELKYKFHIAGLYDFTVQNYRREALNSGWLISDIKKAER